MKNILKLASAVALSCTFLAAHAQQGDGKMMKKDEKTATGKTADDKTKVKTHEGKMHTGKTHAGSKSAKAKTEKDSKELSKDKL